MSTTLSADATAWVEVARSDIDMVRRALIPDPDMNLKGAAYHCQQAAEKGIKALLNHLGLAFPRGGGKGHDVGILVSLIPPANPLFQDASILISLTAWATAYRYPADDPSTAPAEPALADVQGYMDDIIKFLDDVKAEIDHSIVPPSIP